MMNKPIKYILLGNISTGKIIIECAFDKEVKVSNNAAEILKQYHNKEKQEIFLLQSTEGNLYSVNYFSDVLYCILLSHNYPEELVFGLIAKLENEKIALSLIQEERSENIKLIENLVEKYEAQAYARDQIFQLYKTKNIENSIIELENLKKFPSKDNSLSNTNISEGDYSYYTNPEEMKTIGRMKNFQFCFLLTTFIVAISLAIILSVTPGV